MAFVAFIYVLDDHVSDVIRKYCIMYVDVECELGKLLCRFDMEMRLRRHFFEEQNNID